MDLFGWLEGPVRKIAETDPVLASELLALPSWANDGERARVEASLPRLLAEARRLGSPWLEVYVRHWGLQSSVVTHFEVGRGLREAVDLVERAHRPDARDCPQSVCSVQDLCLAYGRVDGPGYAAERETAAAETLARIDPSWPCFRCIGEELATALVDAGRAAEAVAWFEAHRDHASSWWGFGHAEALQAAGRPAEALEILAGIDVEPQGEVGALRREIQRARALAGLGRTDEALAALPAWSPRLADTCDLHLDYVQTLAALRRRGALVTTMAHTRIVAHVVHTLRDRGAIRPCVDAALLWAREMLDEAAPAHSLARELVAVARPLCAELRVSAGAREALAELEARLAATAPEPWTLDAAVAREKMAAIRSSRVAPELDRAEATALALPEVEELLAFVAAYWTQRGFSAVAERYLDLAVRHHPGSPDAWVARLDHHVLLGAWPRVRELVDGLPDRADLAQPRLWFRARLAEAVHDRALAIASYREMLATGEAGANVYGRLATLLAESGDLAGAVDVWTAALARGDAPQVRWERLALATELERWELVRADAAALGLPVAPGEGPVDEHWGPVVLHLPEGEAWAERTGPATAVVRAISAPGTPERFGELWAFRPAPISEEPSGERHFAARRRLAEGGHVGFTLDGVRLDEGRWQALAEAIRELGGAAHRASQDAYAVVDPRTGARLPGGFVKVAVPAARFDAPSLLARVRGLAEGLPGPIVSLELAAALGAEAGAAELAVARAWSMV